jgi:FlaA1/EpsC-like NDP-sugar epimerase
MHNFLIDFSKNILSLHRYSKRVIAIITDVFLCVLCTWFAFILRLDQIILLRDLNVFVSLLSAILAIPIFWLFGLYRTIFRYNSISIILTTLFSCLVYGLIFFLVVGIYGIKGIPKYIGEDVPRSIGVIQPMILFFFVIFSRLLVKFLFIDLLTNKKKVEKKNVVIYGAGNAGRQLENSLENNLDYRVVGFIDDKIQLQKQSIQGKLIYAPSDLEKLIINKNVNLVFLALPSISRKKRNSIIDKLNQYKVVVKTLPSVSQIVDGRVTVSDIKDLNIEDLLNRDEIKPDIELLSKNIYSKIVLVTGAGGSIGSELCRQIIKLKPRMLLILELNEFALFKIHDELIQKNKNLKIIPLLANVQDQVKLELILDIFKVNTVYHTAAYKHVPIVEENICEGIKNNVFGTLAIAKASLNKKVSNFVLISTDKAVRPTNVMGASKRLAEICVDAICNSGSNIIDTSFSIVRFGNVLESSGSVIPKFKKQIIAGGPVTLTHHNVTRYFMTVTEAAQLVIQAGSLGKKAEIFLLDMGKSVKIKDLILRMIRLSGYTVKDEKNKNGEIEIKIIGLRPGEKLYEELLIGKSPTDTIHPKIKKTLDASIPFKKLEIHLNIIKTLIENHKSLEAKKCVEKIIRLYQSNSEIVDHIYLEQLSSKINEKNLSFSKIDEKNIIKFKN